ncbi:MAG: thiamine diphosphokinase [Coriobacteriia bacterium]|nr:thiamine diphosphokinase [Coriobacteriia bacterium]
MTVRRALIVGSAPVPERFEHYGELIGSSDILIAADGGAELCLHFGKVPDVCVGDFDSASPETLARISELGGEIRRFSAVKDVSDLDIAVGVARELVAGTITVIAAFSERLDHTLAALGTLARAADLHAVADEGVWVAHALCATSHAELVLAEAPGTVLSVIALGGDACVSIGGVAYPVDKAQLRALSSLGLSNVAVEPAQHLTVSAGQAIVIVNKAV